MNARFPEAPELSVDQWFNTKQPICLADLRGKVVALHAFQMLCPGCVTHGLPQAEAIRAAFSEAEVAVLGLHTVFEHHEVMGPKALEAFIHEYRISIPVGVDRPALQDRIPITMQAYRMRGTPSLIILDQWGRIRFHQHGRVDELSVGAVIGGLLANARTPTLPNQTQADSACTPGRCPI